MNEREQGGYPSVTLCVSLCETAPPDASCDELEQMLAVTCQEAGFPYCERIYIGSYFCENYFLGLFDTFFESVRLLCQRYDMRATLVLPIFGQAFLERAAHRAPEVLIGFRDVIDEIVVNDVASFADASRWLAGHCDRLFPIGVTDEPAHPWPDRERQPRLGLGRLFSKELRDARYAEMFERTSKPAYSAEATACLHMQNDFAPDMRPLVEIDPTSAIVDVSELAARAEIAIHLPLCYATTGRNCGPASIDEPEFEKFRLGQGCSRHCLRMVQGYLTDEGARYIKHGRTYYFENPACQLVGTDSWRLVYSAVHETMRF